MGAELSAMQNAQANGQLSMKTSSVRASQSQVLAFHSSARWRAHFEASKATAKLDVAQEFGVQAMPTFILIKKGRVIDKVTGVKKEELQKKIEKHRAYYNYA
ncbi:hypothetical protein HYC85_023288 [Camellia sinensis]|uniref:Thioredoxin domain-containing protein n=1 Tax=Camellia sinensis TaxID=4442 RepID=A0A7J7GE57_CAMSI|nr:hypothetical protein HYC85_023288 [Camellia sinensis]